MPKPEFRDIQGLVVRGYGQLKAASYLLLAIDEGAGCGHWLSKLPVTRADDKPERRALNIAFTDEGLARCGLNETSRHSFAEPFRQGMTAAHTQRILGDQGEDAPARWLWGGPETAAVHLLLLVFAFDQQELDNFISELLCDATQAGLGLMHRLDSQLLSGQKEHFGFRDGIAQPYIAEFDPRGKRRPAGARPMALGELLLGYANGYQRLTRSPGVIEAEDPLQQLPPMADNPGWRDLGRNGTYLVFRQLQQDVAGFWRYLRASAGVAGDDEAVHLAAKMVGRWPNGVPLVKAPKTQPADTAPSDNFAYHDGDANGLKCPLGSHIRRTNPRDALEPDPGSDKSLAFSNRHRIVRRGRPYGPPLDEAMTPQALMAACEAGDDAQRGLQFICLNANIGRQFEFVQHTWANNPNFDGLYEDPDPLIGARFSHGRRQTTFTLQQLPVRKRLTNMPAFVRVLGGGYFFLPSLAALAYLAQLGARGQ